MKGLCVIDLDQTLLQGRTIERLGDAFGVRGAVDSILAAGGCEAGNDKSEALMSLFANESVQDFEAACRQFELRRGAMEAVRAIRHHHELAIATASYDAVARAAAERIGATRWAALTPEVAAGRLTGRLASAPWPGDCGRPVCKAEVVQTWGNRPVVAIGDGANDACMLAVADLGIALEPAHPAAREAATCVARAWRHVGERVAARAPSLKPMAQ